MQDERKQAEELVKLRQTGRGRSGGPQRDDRLHLAAEEISDELTRLRGEMAEIRRLLSDLLARPRS